MTEDKRPEEEQQPQATGEDQAEDAAASGEGPSGDESSSTGASDGRRAGTGTLWLAWAALLVATVAGGGYLYMLVGELRDQQAAEREALEGEVAALWERSEAAGEALDELEQEVRAAADEAAAARRERSRFEEELEARLDDLVDERISAFTERVDELVDARVDGFSDDLDALEERIAGLDERQAALLETLDEVSEQAERRHDGWIQAEAAYLAQVAVHRTRYHGDVDSALSALQHADRLLSELGGEGVPGRRAVNDAIDALLAYSPPDRTGIAQRLHGVAGGIDDWPLRHQREPLAAPETPEPLEPGELSEWSEGVERAWQRLREGFGDLIRVHREDDLVPYLPPEHRYFLRENLRLQLEAAQLAMLRDEPEAYRRAVEQAEHWTERHFDADDEQVAAALEELRALKDARIRPEPPDIGDILSPLQPF